jgi:hypothetical protein
MGVIDLDIIHVLSWYLPLATEINDKNTSEQSFSEPNLNPKLSKYELVMLPTCLRRYILGYISLNVMRR